MDDFLALCAAANDVAPQRLDNLLGERLEVLLRKLPLRGAILCCELAQALGMTAGELLRAVDSLQHSGEAKTAFVDSGLAVLLRSSRHYYTFEN
jgi:hypothetical protein